MLIRGFGEIAEKLRRSTVQVRAGRRGQGSGTIVEPEGVIVTNAHVATSSLIEVELWDGKLARASVSKRDSVRDIAILRVSLSELPAAPLADSDQIRVGELVIAIGNPLGFMGALTTGVVHAVGRAPGLGPMKWIQTDVQLAPGSSGGPLADARGRVVGINTMIAGGAGLAVPSNTISRLLRGELSKAPLGIVTRPVQLSLNGRMQLGLMILEIIKDSAAEAASLMLGDIAVGVDGHSLDTIEDLERVLEGSGERIVRIEFLRGDGANIRTVAIRLGQQSMAAA